MDFTIVLVVIVAIVVLIALAKTIHVVPQGEVYVIERLGQFDCVWAPGFHIKTPFIQSIKKKVPTCEITYDVPASQGITKDNVTILADSFMFFTIQDARMYTYGVSNVSSALNALTQSTLRSIIGGLDLDECLSSREHISQQMTRSLDEATDKWGIKVTRVEIKTFTPPRDIQEAMERQMKADRERREQLIRAEADKKASILAAEKDKAVAILNAEAAKEAAELNAEAARIATIKKAEVDKEAALLRAEAAKAVKIKDAEAQAESIRIIQNATAEGLRALNAVNPSEAVLRLKAYDAFAQAANGQATKIIVPSDLQGLVGAASAIKGVLSDSAKR